MRLKKAMMYLLTAFLAFFLVQEPGEAARLVKQTGESAGEIFSEAAAAFTQFLKSLV